MGLLQGSQAPSVWKPSGIGQALPKSRGVEVAGLASACVWEEADQLLYHPHLTAAPDFTSPFGLWSSMPGDSGRDKPKS